MAIQLSKIEWTESTWNPVRGCTRVSEGCRFCYAEFSTEWNRLGDCGRRVWPRRTRNEEKMGYRYP